MWWTEILERDTHTCWWWLLSLFWLNAWLVQSAELITPDATAFVSSHEITGFIRPMSYLYYEFVDEESMSVLHIQDHRKHYCALSHLHLKKKPNNPTKQKNNPPNLAIWCSVAIVSDTVEYHYDFIASAAIVSLINNWKSS